MARIEQYIELNVPVTTAYKLITQFEKFPEFMSHVREVRQIDEAHLHWRAEIGGQEVEWDAEIHEQVPDQRIAWRSTQGARNNGEVSLTPLGKDRSRLNYMLDLEAVGGVDPQPEELASRAEQDLQSFKRLIESGESESHESESDENQSGEGSDEDRNGEGRGEESGAQRMEAQGGRASDSGEDEPGEDEQAEH